MSFRETYKAIECSGMTLSHKKGNNFVFLKNESVFKIKYYGKKNSNIYIFGHKYATNDPFTTYPCDSTLLHLYQISNKKENIFCCYTADDILYKAVVMLIHCI